jgi:hypothetical protein
MSIGDVQAAAPKSRRTLATVRYVRLATTRQDMSLLVLGLVGYVGDVSRFLALVLDDGLPAFRVYANFGPGHVCWWDKC